MVDVFNEVNEELKDEEFNRWIKKFGPKIIIVSVLLVLFTAARVIYNNHKQSVNESQTVIVSEVMELANEDKDSSAVIKSKIAELGSDHKLLSNFLLATNYVENDKLAEANTVYEEIIADKSISSEYKDVAKIYAVQNILNMENADLEKAESLLSSMLSKNNSFYYLAMEKKATIAVKKDEKEAAKDIFENLSNDYAAPESIRSRAERLKTLY